MGRSVNSWNNYVSRLDSSQENDSPEKKLFIAVLSQAAHDCFSTHVGKNERDQARSFFESNNFHFRLICQFADRNPLYVQDRIRKRISQEKTLPELSVLEKYRKKYKRKKCLTGNAYYAAKKRKEELRI